MSDDFGKMFKRDDEVLDMVPTPEDFTELVDTIVDRYDISYIEAITEICRHFDREIESITPLITPKILLAVTKEAASQRLLKDNDFLLDSLD